MAGICREIERELATPAGLVPPDALAAHMAACPACAKLAARARVLDSAWTATRPAEPADPAWDTAWSGIAAALNAAPGPVALPMMAARKGIGRTAWIGLAAAASALLALTLALRPVAPEVVATDRLAQSAPDGVMPDAGTTSIRPIAPDRLAQSAPDRVEIDAGTISILSLDAPGRVTVRAEAEFKFEFGLGNDIYNALESAGVPNLAAREAGAVGFPLSAAGTLTD